MSKLLPIFLLGVGLSFISDKRSLVGFDKYGDKIYKHKEKMIYILMAVILAIFVGLRTAYNDTETYRHAYELLESGLDGIKYLDLNLGANPGFNIFNVIMKTIGISTQSFLMIYAIVTVCIYLWFIRKYSDNLWLSVFLFFTMGCYTFTMAAIKQCVAVAFCLIATDRIIRDKKLSFLFWVFIASTFHPYSLMYLIVPFLNFDAWSGKTYILLILFAIIGFSLQSLLGTVIDITTMLGEEYDASTFMGEGINIFRLAVVWVPVIISQNSGLYQFLEKNGLENRVLHIRVEGSYNKPYFSQDDLERAVKKIIEYDRNKKKWKQNTLSLKRTLEELGLTWEHCAEEIMKNSGIDINEKKRDVPKDEVCRASKGKSGKQKTEKGLFEEIKAGFEIQLFEDADIRKWFDREKVYKKLDQKRDEKNWSILLVSGPKGSGKARTIYYWLRANKIGSEQIAYFDAENSKDTNILRDQWALFYEKQKYFTETELYLFIDNCGSTNSCEYYDTFIRLIRKYKNLKLVVFSEKKFSKSALLQECCDVGLFQLGSLRKAEVQKYLSEVFRINDFTDEDLEKLKCTGYNAEQIRKFIEYINSGLDLDSAVRRFNKMDYPKSIDVEAVESLSEDEIKIAGLFSMFEYTFSKKEASRFQEIFDLEQCQLLGLLQHNILINNSRSNFRIEPLYRNYFMDKLSENERQRACEEIAGYYERTYKYGYRSRRESITDLLCGIEACKYYQKIGKYEKVNDLLNKKKLYRKAVKAAYFHSILDVLQVQYEKRDSVYKDYWNIYQYLFCMVRVGRFWEAEKVMGCLDSSMIEPEECRTAMFRLDCEIKYESMSAAEVLRYIEDKSSIWNSSGYNTVDRQLNIFKAELLIVEGQYDAAEEICSKDFVEPDQITARTKKKIKYDTAVAGTVKLIIKNERGDTIDYNFMDKIEKLFRELQDVRGLSWLLGVKGEILTKEGKNGDEAFRFSIENKSRMRDCSKEYRIWLDRIRDMISDEELLVFVEQEMKRLNLVNLLGNC